MDIYHQHTIRKSAWPLESNASQADSYIQISSHLGISPEYLDIGLTCTGTDIVGVSSVLIGVTCTLAGYLPLASCIAAIGPSLVVSVSLLASALVDTEGISLEEDGDTADTESTGQGVLPSLSTGHHTIQSNIQFVCAVYTSLKAIVSIQDYVYVYAC